MRAYDPTRPLIGLHIPKCAGQSLKIVLGQWFGIGLHLHYYDERRNRMPRALSQAIGRRMRLWLRRRPICIYGHFNRRRGFAVEDYYPSAGQFFTILRDPLATVLSRYFFAKQEGERRMQGGRLVPIATLYASVDEFVAAEIDRPYFIDYLPGPLTPDDYAEVFNTRFVYVGVAEDLQTSVESLAARLGFPTVDVPRLNVSERDETPSPALQAEFVRRRPFEYQLYQYALEHYREPTPA